MRNPPDFSLDDAVDLRRTLAGYGLGIYVPYFLILSQDVGFLWTEPWHQGAGSSAVRQFSMQPVIAHYQPTWLAERVSPAGLRPLVTLWLNELAAGWRTTEGEPERSLAGTGFLEVLKDADITLEPTG